MLHLGKYLPFGAVAFSLMGVSLCQAQTPPAKKALGMIRNGYATASSSTVSSLQDYVNSYGGSVLILTPNYGSNGGATSSVSETVSDSFDLVKFGAAGLTLTGANANTYTGGTTVSTGVLRITPTTGNAGGVTINSGISRTGLQIPVQLIPSGDSALGIINTAALGNLVLQTGLGTTQGITVGNLPNVSTSGGTISLVNTAVAVGNFVLQIALSQAQAQWNPALVLSTGQLTIAGGAISTGQFQSSTGTQSLPDISKFGLVWDTSIFTAQTVVLNSGNANLIIGNPVSGVVATGSGTPLTLNTGNASILPTALTVNTGNLVLSKSMTIPNVVAGKTGAVRITNTSGKTLKLKLSNGTTRLVGTGVTVVVNGAPYVTGITP